MIRVAAALAFTFALLTASLAVAEAIPTDVRKTNGCGCCLSWMKHHEENDFMPKGMDMFAGPLVQFKLENGVPQPIASCLTALVNGYVIESHAPASGIQRLLSERPDAVGLAVPGMPHGAPGMGPEDRREAYEILQFRDDGSAEVFSSYSATD